MFGNHNDFLQENSCLGRAEGARESPASPLRPAVQQFGFSVAHRRQRRAPAAVRAIVSLKNRLKIYFIEKVSFLFVFRLELSF